MSSLMLEPANLEYELALIEDDRILKFEDSTIMNREDETKLKHNAHDIEVNENIGQKCDENSVFLTKPEAPLHVRSNKGFLKLGIGRNLESSLKQILISCYVYIGFILDGYSAGWSAPAIPKLQNATETPLPYVISDTMGAWLASIIFFGGIGPLFAGFLSNNIGRKLCLILGGTIMAIAYLILTFSTNINMLYLGRFFVGFGQSFSVVVSLIYIAEISSPKTRGSLLTLTGVFHNTGALTALSVGSFSSYRGLHYVTLVLAPIFIISCFFIPESPVYHVLKGKYEAAKSCLHYLNPSYDLDGELNKIIFKMQQKDSKIVIWRQLLLKKSNRKALFITVSMYFFQMFSGVTFFMFFATQIFKNAGSSVQPHVATITIGLTSLIGSIFTPIFVDKFGRRLLLITSIGGCGTCMTIMGVYFYLDKYYHSTISRLGWLPLVTMITAFVSYGVGLNNIPHTLNSEMYSTRVRGLGSSISLTSAWMSGFVCSTVSSYLMVYLGSHYTFFLFTAINACALIFVILFVPETTGKTLTEVDEMLAN